VLLRIVLASIPLVGFLLFSSTFNMLRNDERSSSIRAILWRLHLYDTVLLVGGGLCLLLAIRHGGEDYAFDSVLIVSLLLGFFLMALLFSISQWFKGVSALIPIGVMENPIVLWGSLFLFFSHGTMIVVSRPR
jgi:hypothetical protein